MSVKLGWTQPAFFKSLEAQKRIFRHVLERCAEAGDKIVTVHSVRSAKAVLEHIEVYLPPGRGKVVLHWFTGTKSEVKRAIELGCYFSINAEMLANERHISMIKAIPLDRLLTETDGPFTRTGDRISNPADVVLVVDELARLHKKSPQMMNIIIRDNLRRLLVQS
jgi:TatD DNase family protein